MKALLVYFVRLCLLRAGPQDLPASPILLWLALGANLLAGVLLVAGVRADLGLAMVEGLADSLLLLSLLWLALRLQGLGARFLQSATALLGSSALLALVALPPLALTVPAGQSTTPVSELAALLLLVVIGWNLLVFGHILRHSFGLSLALGFGLAVAYTALSYSLLNQLFAVG